MMLVVDSHEDIAWNVLTFGRDYLRSVEETRAHERGTDTPAHNGETMLGLPEWIRGRVAIIFVTLFATPARWRAGSWDTQCYADSDEARRVYHANLEVYQHLLERHANRFHLVRGCDDLEHVLASWKGDAARDPLIGWVYLMEGADAIQHPDDLKHWFEAGVRILGPAWEATRYAGGTREPGPLTDVGRALLKVMAALGMILDLSHMTEAGILEALETYEGAIIASHSNPLAMVPNSDKPHRHLSDDLIKRIAERGGVIGTVLANHFLKDGWQPIDGRRMVTIEQIVASIDHVCQLVGNARHVGIGSDFDGGFGLDKVPQGLDSVADLRLIGKALQARGYTSEDVEDVLGENWLRRLRETLPEH